MPTTSTNRTLHPQTGQRPRASPVTSTAASRFHGNYRRSSGAPGSTSIRSMCATTTSARGLRRWSGPARSSASSIFAAPLRSRAGILRGWYAETCCTILRALRPKHPATQRWSSITPRCSAMSRRQARRYAFARSVGELDAVWISNEQPSVFPAIAEQLPERAPRGKFILAVDGRPIAFSDPHGTALSWVAWRRSVSAGRAPT